MTVSAMPILRYGGFWSRVVASLIDGFVLGMVFGALGAATGRDFFNTDVENVDWLAYFRLLRRLPHGRLHGPQAEPA